MKRPSFEAIAGVCAILLLLCSGCSEGDPPPGAASTEASVQGLWRYTGLTTSGGDDLPLTGIFLFKDGVFVQQAIFDGEPFDQQGAMAHAGPYTPAPGSVHLVAEQTIFLSADNDPPLSFRRSTEHEVSVTRSGDELTLVFGSGTVQEFERVGIGDGEIYMLQDGALAFADDYFILVQGDERAVTSGYGSFEKNGDELRLNVIRWAEASETGARNRRDVVIEATFDGQSFTLADGRSFQVAP